MTTNSTNQPKHTSMMIAINYAISLYQRVKPEGWAIYVNDLQGVHQYLEKLSVHPSTKKVSGDKSAGVEEDSRALTDEELNARPEVKAACDFLNKVGCKYKEEDDGLAYTLRYFDFLAGWNDHKKYATQQSQSATGAMVERIKELEDALQKIYNEDISNHRSHGNLLASIKEIASKALPQPLINP